MNSVYVLCKFYHENTKLSYYKIIYFKKEKYGKTTGYQPKIIRWIIKVIPVSVWPFFPLPKEEGPKPTTTSF